MSGWPHPTSPYHAGEMRVQEQAGARESAERTGRRSIRDYLSEQHRDFFSLLSCLFVGTVDAAGRPWASVLTGPAGFAHSPDPKHLTVASLLSPDDPAHAGLRLGAPVALVGMQLHTRRRNRLNGRIDRMGNASFEIKVDQSFGNCPQYIQAREPLVAADRSAAVRGRRLDGFDDAAEVIVASADTCFVATASLGAGADDPREGVDVSHRGGRPGFIRYRLVAGQIVLTIPDFVGNSFFNTLGNIAVNPVAGFFVPNFSTGAALSLTGRAEIVWEAEELESFAGAKRFLNIAVDETYLLEDILPKRWTDVADAPQLAATGTWSEAEQACRHSI